MVSTTIVASTLFFLPAGVSAFSPAGPFIDTRNSVSLKFKDIRQHRHGKRPLSMATVEYKESSRSSSSTYSPVNGSLVAPSRGGALSVNKSFERVLDGLGDIDKYNAVLQGLAGMTTSSKKKDASKWSTRFEDLSQLLDEMHANKIPCSDRSAASVIDAATASADVAVVAPTFSRLRRAGSAQKYSSALPILSALPTDQRKREKALQGLMPIPQDDRSTDMAYAGAFVSVVSFDFAGDGLAPALHYDASIPMLLSLATAAAVGYDLLKGGAAFTRRVMLGLNRLFTRDVDRESRAEAAAFLVAYLCGLPSFAFQPNVLEALRMVSTLEEERAALSGSAGLHRALVWLLAGPAGEGLAHRQLIVSDPRQGATFLQLARERGIIYSNVEGEDDSNDKLVWAFNEARRMLQDNADVYEALRKRLETGGATVGECVSLIERYR